MTDSYPSAPEPDSGSGVSGTVGTAKDQAADLAQSAAASAKDVAGTAKEGASNVASEAKKQAKDLYAETRTQLTDQAGVQQARVASGLRSLSDELTGMADNSDQQGVASELVSQVASRAGSVASWLDSRDPGTLLEDVKGFARSRPGTFIALAAAAGIVAGRLTRSLASEAKDTKEAESTQAAPASATPAPAPAPVVDPGYGQPAWAEPVAEGSVAPATPAYTATATPVAVDTEAPEAWRS
jgi:hypothetical protein